MPVYTYRCSNCGVQFEKQQSFNDQSLIRCPECGRKALKKVFQPVGIVFKGSGFYATDHHSPSGQSSKKADEKAEKQDNKEKAEKPEVKEQAGNNDTGDKTAPVKPEKKPEMKDQ